MPPDPQKFAQLQALATGGPAGLDAHNAAQAQTQAVQSQALAGYGSANYSVSPELQASLAATESHYAAPGTEASASATAAQPGLAALDSAAAANYLTHENQSTQSKLAAAQAKIDLETKQSQAEQQNKLAELDLQRQQGAAQNDYALQSIAEKGRAFDIAQAMDPNNIKGQAMRDQKAAVENEQSKKPLLQSAFANALDKIGDAEREDQQKKLAEMQGEKAPAPPQQSLNVDWSKVQGKGGIQAAIGAEGQPQQTSVLDPTQVFKQASTDAAQTASWDAQHQADLAAQQSTVDQMNQADTQRGAHLADLNAQGEQATAAAARAGMDLPRFEFEAAVNRGMRPDVAAGKYLSGEDDYILGQQEKQYRRDNYAATIAQREATQEGQAEKRQQADEAKAAAEATGWQPKDLINLSDQTNLSVGDVASRVTSDAWKDVDKMAKNAGKKLDQQDAALLGDTSLAGSQFNEDTFKTWLMANDKLDQQTKLLAFNRYRPLFSLTPNENNVGTG